MVQQDEIEMAVFADQSYEDGNLHAHKWHHFLINSVHDADISHRWRVYFWYRGGVNVENEPTAINENEMT
jgi:hypothetical protein